MPYDLSKYLVIGVSSRALFNLEDENAIFETEGREAYAQYQIEHESDILKPGTAFPIVQAILNLNKIIPDSRKAEVVIMSRNNAATSLRISKSIEHYGLDITRSAWTGGSSLVPYLEPFKIDLFLSANEKDVQEAINANFAAAKIYQNENGFNVSDDKIRIAFDGDAVLFSDESERIFQQDGLEAFLAHEKKNAENNLLEGPFAKLLKTIAYIQRQFPSDNPPILTALVTARNSPAHERVIRTLNAWGVRIDQCFFLGGMDKGEILKAFGAQIFFDDQDVHCRRAYQVVPTARVPYRMLPPVEAEGSLKAGPGEEIQPRALVMGEGLPPVDEHDEPVSSQQEEFQLDLDMLAEQAGDLPEVLYAPENSPPD